MTGTGYLVMRSCGLRCGARWAVPVIVVIDRTTLRSGFYSWTLVRWCWAVQAAMTDAL